MTRVWVAICLSLWAAAAAAQQGTYIQVQALPTRAEGVDSVRRYAELTGRATGYRLGRDWFAVVLGPYADDEAEGELLRLRDSGLIPRDSYLTTLENYGRRYFPGVAENGSDEPATRPAADPLAAITVTPLGAPSITPLDAPPITPLGAPTIAPLDAPAIALPAEPLPLFPDETPAAARRAEAGLGVAEREMIQTALADAGIYSGPVDAAFGPGTRRAMAAWQAAKGHEPTGILTTAQRVELLADYRAVLDGLGLETVRDRAAGIELVLPTALVARESEASPFVVFAPTGDLPVRVLLISQAGDRQTLGGLYEIMQTLDAVPTDGTRELRPTSFDIEGRNSRIVSTTHANIVDGEIKGFTLVWPAGDEVRRGRIWDEMRASFRRVPGVLPSPAAADAPAPELLAGLEVKKPARDRSGFYVDGRGTVLTTHEAVAACERVTLDDTVEVEVAASDEGLGLALLRPRGGLAPIAYARFRTAPPGLESEIAVAGYPFGGALPAPSLNFGRVADPRGLDGDAARSRLELRTEPGETGGPVLDGEGAVVGILLPADAGARRFPEGVSFAAAVGPIAEFLSAAGLSAAANDGGRAVAPEDLTRLAADMTVLVGCWN